MFRHLARDRRLPALERPLVNWGVIGERVVGDLSHYIAVLEHAHFGIIGDVADFHCVESPLLENTEDFLLTALLRHQQHALLRFTEHDFVRRHAGLALRHAIEFDFDSDTATRAHLTGRASQTGGAHVLYGDDCAGLHGFKAGFEQKLFEEGIAHLHVGPLGF